MNRAFLVVLATCGFAGVAVAQPTPDPRRIIGILEVEGPSSDITKQFEAGLEKQVDPKHYWLVGRDKMRERLRSSTKWTDGCRVGLCITEVKVQTGAQVVLLAELTGTGTSFGYVVTLVRTDTGQVLSQESDRCEVCTINEAMSQATLAVVRLVHAIPDKLPDPAGDQGAAIDVAVRAVQVKLTTTRGHHRRVGLTLTVVGAVAAAAGVALYMLSDPHPDYGLAAAAAGGGLALGGVAILTF